MTQNSEKSTVEVEELILRITTKSAIVGVIGLGYVGLPLALTAARAGFRVLGFDIDAKRVALINNGQSGFKHIADAAVADMVAQSMLKATLDFNELSIPDALIIAVPTPLSRHREPDLSFVEKTVKEIGQRIRQGQLVVLESTTWPGTTRQVALPVLEQSSRKLGEYFFLAYSPEREDPGNSHYNTSTIPKIVGADDANSLRVACALYNSIVEKTVAVSSSSTAEAIKLTENIFRSVNIALVNELKIIYQNMGINIWEVIEGAKTKPFGYMPFYPGPGLGGHCIPIDPFYLTWKAREYGISTRFIELAGEINTQMPQFVVSRLCDALNERFGRGLKHSKILIIGVAYKKNIDDTRESPALKLIELIEEKGGVTHFHDPFVEKLPRTREHPLLEGRRSISLSSETIAAYDAVVVATDHDCIDWPQVVKSSRLLVDTRNVAMRFGDDLGNVIMA